MYSQEDYCFKSRIRETLILSMCMDNSIYYFLIYNKNQWISCVMIHMSFIMCGMSPVINVNSNTPSPW